MKKTLEAYKINDIEKAFITGGNVTGGFSFGGSRYSWDGSWTVGQTGSGTIGVSVGVASVSQTSNTYGKDFTGSATADGVTYVVNNYPWVG